MSDEQRCFYPEFLKTWESIHRGQPSHLIRQKSQFFIRKNIDLPINNFVAHLHSSKMGNIAFFWSQIHNFEDILLLSLNICNILSEGQTYLPLVRRVWLQDTYWWCHLHRMADAADYQSYILSVIFVYRHADRTIEVMISSETYTCHMLYLSSHCQQRAHKKLDKPGSSSYNGWQLKEFSYFPSPNIMPMRSILFLQLEQSLQYNSSLCNCFIFWCGNWMLTSDSVRQTSSSQ